MTILEKTRFCVVLRFLPAAALALLLAPPLLLHAETLTIPAVTSLPVGTAASPFFSDVRVFNTSYTAPVSVTAVYRCFLGACPASAPQTTFTLAARESRAFDDMILATFNAPGSAGAVEFTSSGSAVRVTSRLFSTAPMPTVGMFVPGLRSGEAHAVSVLTGLANGAFRTNVGIYNGNDTGVAVTIKLFNGTTQLGTQTVNLGARAGTQVNRIFDAVGQGGLTTTNAYAVVETPGPAVFSYAAVIDNATTDPILVTGAEDERAPSGPGPSAQTINISLTNYSFSPGSNSPVEVTAGAETTLFFEASQGSHGFSGVTELGIAGSNSITAGTDDDGYGGGGQPPRTYRVTFTAPVSARGSTFQFWCTVHIPQNMRGTIHVN
jgi:plastocyanin